MSTFTDQGRSLDHLPAANLRNTNPADPDHAAERLANDERAHGVGTALQLIKVGKPGRALFELVRSVERRNRILGGGTISVPPTCPCGACANSVVPR